MPGADDTGVQRPVLRLDHLGLGIRDLVAAATAYERMGFTLSPLSMHAGTTTPGGPTVPWGSGNRCAMFRNGYLELLGLIDPALPSNVKGLVEQYEGLHIVALDCAVADRAHASLVAAGIRANQPVQLERDASFGPHGDTTRRAKFRNIYLDPAAHPEARFLVLEHQTRDVLWQQHLLEHPNGVQSLESVCLMVRDLEAALARLRPLLGSAVAWEGGYRFDLGRGVVWLMKEESVRRFCPVLREHAVNRVASACFGVRSLAALGDLLESRGVNFEAAPAWGSSQRSIWVGPAEAAHAAIQFIEIT